MDTKAYLNRINYTGSLTPNAGTLRQLQWAHLQTVPFENLSIHWGQPIVLDNDALFEKVVLNKWGGFCYELNGLFATLLRELGFDVQMLGAEVANAKGEFGPPFDHMTLLVTLAERWLVEVGFGDSFVEPLLADERGIQQRGGVAYQIEEVGERLLLKAKKPNKAWESQYRFDLRAYELADYAGMCHYQQTSPDSHFTQKRVCSVAKPNGRITLTDDLFIVTENGIRHEQPIQNETEFNDLLQTKFGIK